MSLPLKNRDGSPNCGLPDPVDQEGVYHEFEEASKRARRKRQGQVFFDPRERPRFELEFNRRMRELTHWRVYWLHRLRNGGSSSRTSPESDVARSSGQGEHVQDI